MSGDGKLRCYNPGCGKEYSESENSEDCCTYHPGAPVFHDALKGWSCCNRRVTDFTEFLSIQGCTKAKHCNVKPAKTEKKTVIDDKITEFTGQTKHREPELKEPDARPSNELPYQKLKAVISDSLRKALEKHQQCAIIDAHGNETATIQKGTTCKNNSCNVIYENALSDKETCVYHPGNPVFHEGLKFWSCCLKRTSDFDEFLKQQGCLNGSHVWFLTDKQKSKAVRCRYDYYQMGSSVVVTIYAKLCDPDKCFVETNQTCMRAEFIFGNASKFEMNMELYGVIDPDKSSVTYSTTKAEIKLKKGDGSTWPSLEFKNST